MAGPIYKDILITDKLDRDGGSDYKYTRSAFDWKTPEKVIIEACRNPKNYWCLDGSMKAVYVISADGRPYSKIGIASNPEDRRCGLQTANWDRLHVRFALWVWGDQAFLVEQLALEHARNLGHEVRGEWVGLGHEDAFSLVVQSAAALDVEAGDITAIERTKSHMVLCRSQYSEAARQQGKAAKFTRLGY